MTLCLKHVVPGLKFALGWFKSDFRVFVQHCTFVRALSTLMSMIVFTYWSKVWIVAEDLPGKVRNDFPLANRLPLKRPGWVLGRMFCDLECRVSFTSFQMGQFGLVHGTWKFAMVRCYMSPPLSFCQCLLVWDHSELGCGSGAMLLLFSEASWTRFGFQLEFFQQLYNRWQQRYVHSSFLGHWSFQVWGWVWAPYFPDFRDY